MVGVFFIKKNALITPLKPLLFNKTLIFVLYNKM